MALLLCSCCVIDINYAVFAQTFADQIRLSCDLSTKLASLKLFVIFASLKFHCMFTCTLCFGIECRWLVSRSVSAECCRFQCRFNSFSSHDSLDRTFHSLSNSTIL